jgi:glycosyltransferase involved in cell wall biosynthesis
MSCVEPPVSGREPTAAEGSVGRAADPVTAAIQDGLASRRKKTLSLRAALAEASDLLRQARGDGAYKASLPRMYDLIREHPGAEDLQFSAARLIMEDGDAHTALAVWQSILDRDPLSPEPLRMVIRLTSRLNGQEAARAIMTARFPDVDLVTAEQPLFALALGLEELGEAAKAEDTLCRLTRLHPGARNPWRHLIRVQEARGGMISAQRSAASAMANCGDAEFSEAHARISREINLLTNLDPNVTLDDSPYSVKVLNAILANVVGARKAKVFAPRRHLGGVLMITGSLGSGGAERQLVTTALSLHQASQAGRMFGSADIVGPVSVACRSLTAKKGNDFFLGALQREGIQVTDYSRLPRFGGQLRHSRARDFSEVMGTLPARVREGIVHLVDYLRHESPDVVHIWQDGMIFAAGLAALIAHVPRIVLSVRTLPPTDRVNRWRRELEPIYRAMLSTPDVVIIANSTLAARRYEEWLGMPRGSAPVIHNGVTRLDETPGPEDELMWRSFALRTADAEFTVGAVMRLDENKRPLDWMTVAESLHRRHPRTRFVIVGSGALLQEAQEYAHRLGIADRVLFTGVSGSVGYWLTKMDTLLLLSRFEGMPNVLIEAQLAGKPVVSTPAGGASETLLSGRTGWLTASAEVVDVQEVTGLLADLVEMTPDRRREIGIAARKWAEEAFSVELMLERTVRVFMASYPTPMIVGP